ncbi:MAG TPA: diguanylate cyclase, partial [Ramlibacter sp.]|nr:diguanylate cyclase [Ramlibacter sp.]
MDSLAAGFWGAFFGTVALMLAGSLAAFIRSLHRVALTAFLFGVISALFVLAFLGVVPLGSEDAQQRLLAHVCIVSAAVLGVMVLAMLGLLRHPVVKRRVRLALALIAVAVIVAGWLLDASQSLALSSAVTLSMAVTMLLICLRNAIRGDRLAWSAVSGVCFMLVAIAGLSWIALARNSTPLWVHAISAVSAMAYVSTMATALWIRYSYLIELSDVVRHGPSYDPITRMRTHSETGQMVGLAFFGQGKEDSRPLGVIAISIGNLSALENLHGRAAFNHALFVCASRLRRCVPPGVETGRMGDDGFLLLVRNSANHAQMAQIAR